jgi:hypothetical protein
MHDKQQPLLPYNDCLKVRNSQSIEEQQLSTEEYLRAIQEEFRDASKFVELSSDTVAQFNEGRWRETQERSEFEKKLSQSQRELSVSFGKWDLIARWSPWRAKPTLSRDGIFCLLLNKEHADAFVGDLEERFIETIHKAGKLRANLWYAKESIRSLEHLAWAWLKRTAGLDELVELFRRIGS